MLTLLKGLESVKQQFLSIKAKVDTVVRQNVSLKGERFGAALLGNPGTGDSTSPMAQMQLTRDRENNRRPLVC